MRQATQAEGPFTLSEILEEEFREVHDCRGRFFEFHWNNPAHIAERLKAYGLRLEETADVEILRGFSEFSRLGKEQRKKLQGTLTRFTGRLNDLARDPNLASRLLPNNPLQDTEEIRSFQKSQCDANARLLQCLLGKWIHPRSEPATRTGYFTAGDLENAAELAAELDRRFSIMNPFSSPGTASEERRKRAVLDALNRLVKQPHMYVDAVASATPKEVPAANRVVLETCYRQFLNKSPSPHYEKDDPDEEARLAMIYHHIHALAGTLPAENGDRSDRGSEQSSGPRVALCLSGGGIRSATYALGILQGLARKGLLKEFHYLSTVSGGGYVGSWLSAWIKRKGLAEVDSGLRNPPTSLLNPEPAPIRYLRRFSNYLTPKLGLLSADTWAAVGTILRNMLLNWMVLLPLIMAFLALPYLVVAIVRLNSSSVSSFESRVNSADMLIGGCVLATLALAYIHIYRPSLQAGMSEKWKAWGNQNTYLFMSFLPLIVSAGLITTWWAWVANDGRSPSVLSKYPWGARVPGSLFMLVAAGVHLAGWIISVVALRRWKQLQWTWQEALAIVGELLVIILSGALGGYLAWMALQILPDGAVSNFAVYYGAFAIPVFLSIFLLAATLFVGLSGRFTDDEDREWWARSGGWALMVSTVWGIIAALVLFVAEWVSTFHTLLGMISSGIVVNWLGFSSKSAANAKEKAQGDWTNRLPDIVLLLAAPVFAALMIIVLSWTTAELFRLASLHVFGDAPIDPDILITTTHVGRIVLLAIFLALVSAVFAWFININRFSLHALYRNRIVRAYLGASNADRKPNVFTGFDPNDNQAMCSLGTKPLHTVNIALNLVGGKELAWQQRKAESFTVTALHAGNRYLGYRRSSEYGRQITLGTAVAISGAAASPNMGYHSSPAITFLLTLFNIRLGWWLGNPAKSAFKHASPGFALGPLLAEAFGLTNAERRFVNLSDGGHFENLGLYEMVLRRCHFIVVSDAGRDEDHAFEDLGNAIRKIRIDSGIPITIDKMLILPRKRNEDQRQKTPKYCAIGRIQYSEIDGADLPEKQRKDLDGILIYLKPSLVGDEPIDIYNYAATNQMFPHESTGDQWFSESQFESYRMLGLHTIEWIYQQQGETNEPAPATGNKKLDTFLDFAKTYVKREKDAAERAGPSNVKA